MLLIFRNNGLIKKKKVTVAKAKLQVPPLTYAAIATRHTRHKRDATK